VKAGCIPHVPKPQRGLSVREVFFRKDEFRSDAGRNAYVCPGGAIADANPPRPVARPREKNWLRQPENLPRLSAAHDAHDDRSVSPFTNEDALDRMAQRLKGREALASAHPQMPSFWNYLENRLFGQVQGSAGSGRLW
jgi:hypothetical protein